MKKLSCIAVDDNPDALDMLVRLIKADDNLELLYAGVYPVQVLQVIREKGIKPDLLFLDIEMPLLPGTKFAEQVEGSMVIFTTAHRNYGPEAFEQQAVDYLLKPILAEKFNKAVAKARFALEARQAMLVMPDKIRVPDTGKQTSVWLETNEIIYCEASSNFTDFFLKGRKHTAFITMKKLEEILVSPWFVRINRSYMINMGKVTHINAYIVTLEDGTKLRIGPTYKPALTALLNKKS